MQSGISTPGGEPEGPGIWRNRAFLRLWSAFSISEAGSQLTQLALPLTAIVLLHASAFQVGLLTAAGFLPFILFGLFSGVVVDRIHPLPLLMGGDLGRAALLGSIPLAALAGRLTLAQIYVVAFVAGSLTVIFGVAHQSTIHRIVHRADLIDANSKVELSLAGAQVTGPGLGGFLIGALSAPAAIALDAASFLVSAAFLAGLRIPFERQPSAAEGGGRTDRGGSFLAQIREGLGYVICHPVLRALAAGGALATLFGTVYRTVLLLYFVRVLHLAPVTIGVVVAAAGIGAVIGAALATRLGRRLGIGRVIVLGAIPAGWLLIPLAPVAFPVPVLLLGNFLGSVLIITHNVTQRGLRQAITPARMQGRMTATMRFLILAPVPLGALIGGALGSFIGLRNTLWVGAFGSMLMLMPILLSPIPGIRDTPDITPEAPSLADLPAAGV